MSTQQIRFTGINRNINSTDSNLGDCQELINIKSENGILKIHKNKQVISERIPYTRVIIHDIQSVENYIGFDDTGIVWFSPTTGDILARLYKSENNLNNIHICTQNNMVVISDKNTAANTAYLYNEGKYELFIDDSSLNVPLEITHTTEVYSGTGELYSDEFELDLIGTDNYDERWKQNYAIMQAAYNKFFTDNKKWVNGYYLVGINVTLWDNTESKLTNLTPFYPIYMPIDDGNNEFPFYVRTYNKGSNIKHQIILTNMVQRHTYQIKALSDENIKRNIKSVNVYISNPISPVIFDENNLNFIHDVNATDLSRYNALRLQESNLEKQLLYKYKSYSIDQLRHDIVEEIEFGLDILPINKTLDVDSGLVSRAGQMKAYNNRIHYFNSVAKVDLSQGYSIKPDKQTGVEFTADAIICLRDTDGSDIRLRYNGLTLKSLTTLEPYYVLLEGMTIVQDSRAYKIIFNKPGYYAECLLESSPRYNYSYGFFKTLTFIEGDQYDKVTSTGIYQEPNAINVTSQNNPINFPVEHSYAFAGAVRDIAYATEPISQTQISQYPLYVFTDEGIFTLEQGSGNVLYSNITMINTDHIAKSSQTCQTRNGVAYIANGSVYILSGRNNLNISLPLKGHIDTDIQQCPSYAVCCQSQQLYDISTGLSIVDNERFLEDAILSYSAPQDELYVSNREYEYSYVFSFAYKSWSKVTGIYSQVSDNIMQKQLVYKKEILEAASKGSILVHSALPSAARMINITQSAELTGDPAARYSGEFVITMEDQQIARVTAYYPLPLYMIVAELCGNTTNLVEYYDGQKQTIHCTEDLGKGIDITIADASTSEVIASGQFDKINGIIDMPAKGLGQITVTCAEDIADTIEIHENTTRDITEADTADSIAQAIAELINAESHLYHVSADATEDTVDLTANTTGTQGDNIRFSVTAPRYIDISIEPMSGGIDRVVLTHTISELIDCTQDVDSDKIIHIQSCPMSWDNAYALINRTVLHCKAKLRAEHNLSVYLFASNNLTSWQCVAASQKTDVDIDHIRLSRVARSYKHYIVIIGGIVSTLTEISSLMVDFTIKYSNKLR